MGPYDSRIQCEIMRVSLSKALIIDTAKCWGKTFHVSWIFGYPAALKPFLTMRPAGSAQAFYYTVFDLQTQQVPTELPMVDATAGRTMIMVNSD